MLSGDHPLDTGETWGKGGETKRIKSSRMMIVRESSPELRDGARAGSGLEAATTAVKAHSIWIMHVH